MMVRQAAVQGQCRLLHQRHADDLVAGLRHLGRKITNENISLKHYRRDLGFEAIPRTGERRERFGEFYYTEDPVSARRFSRAVRRAGKARAAWRMP